LKNGSLKEIYELLKWLPVDGTNIHVHIYKGENKTLTEKQFQEDEEKIIKEYVKQIQGLLVESLQEASFVFPRFCELAYLTLSLIFLST
jgi:hypothetical protein